MNFCSGCSRELHPLFGCTSILDWRVREPLWHLRASIGQTLLAFYGTRRVRLSLSDPFSIELVNICGRIRKKGPYCAKYDFLLFLSCHHSKAIRTPGFPLGFRQFRTSTSQIQCWSKPPVPNGELPNATPTSGLGGSSAWVNRVQKSPFYAYKCSRIIWESSHQSWSL